MRHILNTIVTKLTPRPGQRHKAGSQDRALGCKPVPAVVLLLLVGGVCDASPAHWQALDDVRVIAEDFVRAKTGDATGRTTVQAGSLDSRHRLPLCDQPLEAFMRRGAKIAARTIVGVRCAGGKPWKVYVPVDVIVTETILTARRTLPRDHLLTKADLATDKRDVSRMISGYFSDPSGLMGQRLKQQIIAGRAITPAMLQADRVIRRGQSVTLTVSNRGLNIKMAGKALMDGAISQRIRVENSTSGRIVEGIVRSPEIVEILVPKTDSFFHAKPKVSVTRADTPVSNNDR
jgi:flagella basal body P-ring formation protein FlgA